MFKKILFILSCFFIFTTLLNISFANSEKDKKLIEEFDVFNCQFRESIYSFKKDILSITNIQECLDSLRDIYDHMNEKVTDLEKSKSLDAFTAKDISFKRAFLIKIGKVFPSDNLLNLTIIEEIDSIISSERYEEGSRMATREGMRIHIGLIKDVEILTKDTKEKYGNDFVKCMIYAGIMQREKQDFIEAKAHTQVVEENTIMASDNTKDSSCAVCGRPADKQCSRCNKVQYCCRKCQEKHWKYHRRECIKKE